MNVLFFVFVLDNFCVYLVDIWQSKHEDSFYYLFWFEQILNEGTNYDEPNFAKIFRKESLNHLNQKQQHF